MKLPQSIKKIALGAALVASTILGNGAVAGEKSVKS